MKLCEVSANVKHKGLEVQRKKVYKNVGCIIDIVGNWHESDNRIQCIDCETCRKQEVSEVLKRVTWAHERR